MEDMQFVEFDGDDEAYLRWISNHPYGFVVNAERSRRPAYMVLHRASCNTIREYSSISRKGGFTERNYIKVCADDIDSLRSWARRNGRHDGSFSSECQKCYPLDDMSYFDG